MPASLTKESWLTGRGLQGLYGASHRLLAVLSEATRTPVRQWIADASQIAGRQRRRPFRLRTPV